MMTRPPLVEDDRVTWVRGFVQSVNPSICRFVHPCTRSGGAWRSESNRYPWPKAPSMTACCQAESADAVSIVNSFGLSACSPDRVVPAASAVCGTDIGSGYGITSRADKKMDVWASCPHVPGRPSARG